MQKSESIKELATALAKSQAEMQNPEFDKMNPHFKNAYASLASVRNAVYPVMAKNGLSIVQQLTSDDSGVFCANLLMHNSGEWLELDPYKSPSERGGSQGFGSAATYARRYSLQALAGVVGETDDDGENSTKKQKPESSKPVSQSVFDSLPAEEQTFLAQIAEETRAIMEAEGYVEALAFLRLKKLDADEQVAINSLFDSKERSAMKAASKAANEAKND